MEPGSELGLIGQTIDRYRIERLLGEGGFGAVYVARHSVTDRRVALKVLHADRAETRETVARFVQEAKAAAAIGNPHIIEVLDAGATDDGKYFLAMELLEGQGLDTLLEREGPFTVERSVELCGQILEALGAAHDKAIIHRDLKPANVFVTRDRQGHEFVKLLDFGISKVHGPQKLGTLTEAGMVLGTPQYMAPEQSIASTTIDGRADLWSASVLLYEMLSGRLPYEADTYQRLLLKIHTEPPAPLSQVAPHLPPLVTAVVERGLAKDPDARWRTAAAMAEAVGKAARGDPSAMGDAPTTSQVMGVGHGLGVTPPPSSPTTGPIAPTVGLPTPAGFATPGRGAGAPSSGQPSTPLGFASTGLAPASPPSPASGGGYPPSGGGFGPSTGGYASSPAGWAPTPAAVPVPPTAQPRPPKTGGSGGVGLLVVGCGLVLVLGLVIGAAGLIAYLGSSSFKPPSTGTGEQGGQGEVGGGGTGTDPFPMGAGGGDRPGGELVAIAPRHELVRRKIAIYRDSCIGRYAERAASSRARYLSWADEAAGPRAHGRHVYGLYTVNGDGRDCQQAVEQANALEPDDPRLEAEASELAAAIVELAPLLVEAERYYDQGDWQDDNMAKGDEMHRPLMSAFNRMQAATEALVTHIRQLEAESDDALLANIGDSPAEQRRARVERVRVEARKVRDLAARIRVEDRVYVGVPAPEMNAQVSALEQAVEQLREFAATRPDDEELASYVEGADEVLGPAKELRRAVEGRKRLSSTEASWVGTSSGWMVDGSPDAYVQAYDGFLSDEYRDVYD